MSNSLRPHGLQLTRILCPRGFPRQEYWSGLPSPPPGDLPNPGIKPRSPALQVDSLLSEPPEYSGGPDGTIPAEHLLNACRGPRLPEKQTNLLEMRGFVIGAVWPDKT